MERQFLECLEFNINVPSSVYAKYYYELRTLAMANDLQLPLQPLYKERARKLEVRICFTVYYASKCNYQSDTNNAVIDRLYIVSLLDLKANI